MLITFVSFCPTWSFLLQCTFCWLLLQLYICYIFTDFSVLHVPSPLASLRGSTKGIFTAMGILPSINNNHRWLTQLFVQTKTKKRKGLMDNSVQTNSNLIGFWIHISVKVHPWRVMGWCFFFLKQLWWTWKNKPKHCWISCFSGRHVFAWINWSMPIWLQFS